MMNAGTRLGSYEIVAQIGMGGMGEVYRAMDTRLNREVAIKVLLPAVANDPERLARFGREAQLLASLNHPHIAAIYGIEDSGDLRALVMELVEGPTLADRLARGPIPLQEALPIARQIAEALEAAHEQGIIHRDLKPANIKVRPDGNVKVLDFGLAKAMDHGSGIRDQGSGDAMNSPTLTAQMTQRGVILGTAAYMAPEQAKGKAVDRRTDIWAFGVVLYEMLTGERAFKGDDVSDTLASVLKDTPTFDSLPAGTPLRLRRLLERCLDRDVKMRLRDIGEARVEIARIEAGAPDSGPMSPRASASAPRSSVARALPWVVSGILAVALATVSVMHFREKRPDAPLSRLTIQPPDRSEFDRTTPPAISPDGRQVVFAATSTGKKSQLWLRPLDSLTARPLVGTENGIFPFWSPDGKSIGFFAAGKLKRMNVAGGPAMPLADAAEGRGGTWSPDGVIVFAPAIYSGLHQVPASGGTVRAATRFDPGAPTQKFPWFLPDGRHFIYLRGAGGRDQQTIQLGSLDAPGEDRSLLSGVDSAAMYAQGYLLFARDATLVARPFDAARLAVGGDEVAVAEHLPTRGLPLQAWAFSVSTSDVLVHASAGLDVRQLTWVDRAGGRLGTVGDPDDLSVVHLSPNGRTAAVVVSDAATGHGDVWMYDLLRGLRTRFTSGPSPHTNPTWSPDGRIVVFADNRTGRFDLYRKLADGSRDEELLYADNLLKAPKSFSPDGTYLAYEVFGDPKTGSDLWILPGPLGAQGASKPYPFMRTEFNEQHPQFSPDGHWIAYQSDESGRYEVYLAPFPGPGGKRQVSTAGGQSPRWQADGRALFYIEADNRLMAAAVNLTGGGVAVTEVDALFGPVADNYDVSADGQRFLTVVSGGGEQNPPLTVVQNWAGGIKNGR